MRHGLNTEIVFNPWHPFLFGGLEFDHDDVVFGGFGFVVEGALAEFAGGVFVELEGLLHEGVVGLGEVGEFAFEDGGEAGDGGEFAEGRGRRAGWRGICDGDCDLDVDGGVGVAEGFEDDDGAGGGGDVGGGDAGREIGVGGFYLLGALAGAAWMVS